MFKRKYLLISMLILLILTIGFVSASDVIDSDLNENVLSDDALDSVDTSGAVSTEQSVDLDSNSVDAENLNAVQDPVLQRYLPALYV